MIIYTTTPVETLEQAKQLPHGTVVRMEVGRGDFTVLALTDRAGPGQRFWFAAFSMNAFTDEAVVGGEALTPIEVEPESIQDRTGGRSKTVYVGAWRDEK